MADDMDLTPEQRAEQAKIDQARRNQQANWFLGGALLVISCAGGYALLGATRNPMFFVGALAIGVIGAWAVNRFAK
ncbi:hypothetical protein [Timonella senegalensis]|uniref:hypothetical protein n=1 Tax=Timonella senegalensis TaxID=1465825 RepID=UPI0002EFC268|nr:hypothetical protein [Timonella senegalensis]